MGMFDELTCEYPLPVDGANKFHYQTKDTPAQLLDQYKIDVNGQLWHEVYGIVDRSDPNANGAKRLAGCMTRQDSKWAEENLTGEINFYAFKPIKGIHWIEFSAKFIDGKVKELRLVANEAAK